MIAPQANRWKLGLFVTLVSTLAVGALIVLGATELSRRKLDAVTYFDETVQGLDAGSPLKWRGVTIGSVSRIGVAPDRRRVEVHMDVYSDLLEKFDVDVESLFDRSGEVKLRDNMHPDSRVRLVSAGITGLKFLELDRLPDAPVPELNFELPHNYLPSAPSVMVGLEMGVTRTVEMLPEMIASIDELVSSVDAIVKEFHAADLFSDLKQTMAMARGTLSALEDAAGTLHLQLEAADTGATAAALRDAARSVSALSNETGAPGAGLGAELRALRETLERARELIELIERQPDALLAGRASQPAPER